MLESRAMAGYSMNPDRLERPDFDESSTRPTAHLRTRSEHSSSSSSQRWMSRCSPLK